MRYLNAAIISDSGIISICAQIFGAVRLRVRMFDVLEIGFWDAQVGHPFL
ncbi:hypothetical protein HMPREF0454_00577 [Hafnia alvei ATCC 51873]|uniref:Uncharacterized protein n=1 Tax=Hafnia alvei ATCC 51873 TaxID=1002364 RepID=G9Y1W7_HAFAL|nr:hypothetical protein HMPREF0454_00577 [Hafnia alvei ATCC 51873]